MKTAPDKKGILFIISAPSGAGKTTLVRSLCARDPQLHISVSHTTRPPRSNEIQGVSYHFVDEAAFREMIYGNRFLEFATVFDHHYGTSRDWVERHLAAGYDVVLEIDWQGAMQVRRALPDTVTIFILPPSFQALEQRLRGRGDDENAVRRRMHGARIELSHYYEYEYILINESVDQALQELGMIVMATRHKYTLQKHHYDELAKTLMEQAGNIE
jgi:guanylate kinase